MKRTFILVHDEARRNAAAYMAIAPAGHVVTVKEPTRNLAQNARLHALFCEIAKQEKYLGRELTPAQWKTLFISGHAIATGEGADMIPGLHNEFVNIRESSAHMSVARMSSLIEYTTAWAVENGVRLSA